MKRKVHYLTTTQFIIIGYIITILIGCFLLCLPFSSKDGTWTSFIDGLFTSTSAACVTGLVVKDTYAYWSTFGKVVIILLIQIGGIGFMTIFSLMGLFLKRKINLYERKIIMQASGNLQISGVISLVKKIIKSTLLFESFGALLLMFKFIPKYGFTRGIFSSIFTAISAFCNAGFDLSSGDFTSLVAFQNDVLVNIVVMLLIICGGLGFLVWSDIVSCKAKFKNLHIHSKIVLVSTLCLIFIPAVLFFIFEYNKTMVNFSTGQKLLASFFQSVTTRTAGFNTIDMALMSDSSSLLTMCLMLIGGSPGSTAGGIKTTTFVVLLFSVIYSTSRSTHITVGTKKLERNIAKQASAILTLFLTAIIFSSMIIMAVEQSAGFKEVIFESISAIGTVGLSMGLTPSLGVISKLLLIVLMFIGRVGALTIILFFNRKQDLEGQIQRPTEKIIVG